MPPEMAKEGEQENPRDVVLPISMECNPAKRSASIPLPRHGTRQPPLILQRGVPHGESASSPNVHLCGPSEHMKFHWLAHETFKPMEVKRREVNDGGVLPGRLFVSHCWRKGVTQVRKRQMIAALSTSTKENGPGLTYWADFLDLQADGPVEWVKKIEEGIDNCSKMVCFLDEAYLTSYNCLREVAYALEANKPVVLVVIDQEAWDLLTLPGGAATAWENNKWGAPLSRHENFVFPGVDGFSKDSLTKLYNKLASINLCPCRPMDESNWGTDHVLDVLVDYVCKDISYMQEHAKIQSLSTTWDAGARRGTLLLQGSEALNWDKWIGFAEQAGLKPSPTPLQKSFVKASVAAAKRRRSQVWGFAAILVAVTLVGAAVSVAYAIREAEAKNRAAVNAREASLWTILGKIRGSNSSIWETRAIMHVLRSSEANRQELSTARAEASRIFYRMLQSPAIHVGQLEGLEKSWGFGWSPDGKRFAASSQMAGNPVLVQDLQGTQAAKLPTSGSSAVHGLSWAPDGSLVGSDVSYGLTRWPINSVDVADQQASEMLPETLVQPSSEKPIYPWRPVVWIPGDTARLVTMHNDTGSNALRLWTFGGPGNTTSVQFGDGNGIADVVASPDGTLLAVSRINGDVHIWDLSEGGVPQLLQTIVVEVFSGQPWKLDLSFHPDGKTLACALGSDVRLYNVQGRMDGASGCRESCTAFQSLEGEWAGRPWAGFNPFIDALTQEQRLLLQALGWNATSWNDPGCSACRKNRWGDNATQCVEQLYILEKRCPLQQLRLWADLTETERLAAGLLDFTESSWDMTSPYSCCAAEPLDQKPLALLELSRALPNALALQMSIPGLGNQSQAAQSPQQEPDQPLGILFSPSGSVEKLWLQSAHNSPDGTKLAIGTWNSVELWDLTGRTLQWPSQRLGLPATGTVNTVEWSPDSRYLGLANSDGVADIWDFRPDRSLVSYPLNRPHRGQCVSVDSSPLDDDFLVSLGKADNKLKLHNLVSGGDPLEFAVPADGFNVNSARFSSNGKLAIGCAHNSLDQGKLLLWDQRSETFDVLVEPNSRNMPVIQSVAWSPDGNMLATAEGAPRSAAHSIALWDLLAVPPRPARRLLVDGPVLRVSISPDGKLLASCQQQHVSSESPMVTVWELATGRQLDMVLPSRSHGQFPVHLEWSPALSDGIFTLAVADAIDQVLYIAHGDFSKGGVSVHRLQAHVGGCLTVRWRPDGQVLATAGATDEQLRLWDVSDPSNIVELQIIDIPSLQFLDLSWIPPGNNAIAIAGDSGEVRVVPIIAVDDMAEIISGMILPFARRNFTEADAAVLGVPLDVVATSMQ